MTSPSLTGYQSYNPLRYTGIKIPLVPIVMHTRAPTSSDIRDPHSGKYYVFGTQWLVGENPTTGSRGDLWYLGYIASNVATWKQFATV